MIVFRGTKITKLIKNRKVAEGPGTYKHTAGGHQKPEKEKMSVSRVVSFQSVNYQFFHS